MKIRTTLDLTDAIANSLAWRKKEITGLRILIATRGREHERELLRRVAVPVLYAHWEGFAKEASVYYLELISRQRLKYGELRENFLALAARGRIRQAAESRRLATHMPVIDFILQSQDEVAQIPVNATIDTESNLSSSVLRDILLCLGLQYNSTWSTKELLIDGSLLRTRNEVAHGDRTVVSEATYLQLHELVLELLEQFRTAIENAAAQRLYRRRSA